MAGMHPHILHNDAIREASQRLLSPGQVGLLNGWGVFSTIRVLNGVLFAFERHWQRMLHDAALLRVPFPSEPDRLHAGLLELVAANRAFDAVLRVAVVRNRGGAFESPGLDRDFDVIAFTTGLKDWGAGVRLAVVPNGRYSASPFAGAKILSWASNLAWLEEAQSRAFDEVILLNEYGQVCECTSANIFVAQDGQVWTPPLTSGCLPGITRELLLHEITASGLKIGERDLHLADLEKAGEVFITSTTRELLPVLSVEGLSIRQDGAVRRCIQAAFSGHVESYVARALRQGRAAGGARGPS